MVWPHLKHVRHGKDNSPEQEGEEDKRKDWKATSESGQMGFGDSLRAVEGREK